VKIRLRIERLILDGLPVSGGQGPLVRAAVESELARLIADGGLSRELRSGGAVPGLRGADIRVDQASPPAGLGKQIAGAVYGGIGSKK
jgi:hypothetical protein